MKLNEALTKSIEFNGHEYAIDLSFDLVLDVFDVLELPDFYEFELAELALEILIDDEYLKDLEVTEKIELWNHVYTNYVSLQGEEYVEYDQLGNIMPQKKKRKAIDLVIDADRIFASFMQSYKINLFENHGKLHWEEFKAYLNGLPEDTSMRQVMHFRTWEESPGESKEYREYMKQMRNRFSLEDENEWEDEDETIEM